MNKKKHYIFILLSIILLLAIGGVTSDSEANSSDQDESFLIKLKYAEFDPMKEPMISQEDFFYPESTFGEPGTYIIQFVGPVLEEWKHSIIDAGGQLGNYIPEYAFEAYLDSEVIDIIQEYDYIRWIGLYQPAYKLERSINFDQTKSHYIYLAPWANRFSTIEKISKKSETHFFSEEFVVADVSPEEIYDLASEPGILWIEPYSLAYSLNDIAAEHIMNAISAWDSDYKGDYISIGVADTGLDTGDKSTVHSDFFGRVENISSWPIVDVNFGGECIPKNIGEDDGPADFNGHGTHVTGSFAGDGAKSSGKFKGLAYEANINFQAIEQYVDFPLLCLNPDYQDGYYLLGIPHDTRELFQEAYDWGVRIHNNSWGSGSSGGYTSRSLHVDDFMWENKNFLIVTSAGNSGNDNNSDGYVDTGSIGAPATAKNVLSVGASESERSTGGYSEKTWGGIWSTAFPSNPTKDDRISSSQNHLAAFSSRGPTDDGRIKPDVVAPGTDIISVRSSQTNGTAWGVYDSDYLYSGGTSMASPLTAGAAALVREYYIYQEDVVNPSAALIKATLINTAVDISGYGDNSKESGLPIPNMHEGWGRVDVGAATDGSYRKFYDVTTGLSTNNFHTYDFYLDSSAQFKVSLVWTDPRGSLSSGKKLVNDLNLQVISPDGTIFKGNVFNEGWSKTGGEVDHLNNVENVYLESIEKSGVWTVKVIGENVPNGPQPYALVTSLNGLNKLKILSPTKGSSAFAGSFDQPSKIVVRITKPRDSLNKDNFRVYIGNKTASIISFYEGSGEYVFEIMPPHMDINGLYNLMVMTTIYDRAVYDKELEAVNYSDQANVDVDLIIDRSGSMSGTPLASAKAAASQFVDYMQEGDMVGVVSFESGARVDYALTEIGDPGLITPIFSDDMESGTDKWVPDSPWGRTMLRFSSPMHSWTDSPLGNYANDINISLRTAEEIMIPGEAITALLSFDTRYDIEYDFDNGFVEVSTDGGINWTQIGAPITGTNTIWHTRGYNLSDYIGQGILLRFRLETDSWDTAQGWFIDDVVVGVAMIPDVQIEAKTAIDSLASGGGTNIGAGLQTGQNQLTSLGNPNHPWSMVLLTDGNGSITNETISAIAESKTVVHTIGLGNGVDQNLLLNIATQTGGTYNYAPTPEQLSEVYNTISGTVSNRQTLLSATGTVDENMVDSKTVVVDSTVSDAIFSLSWADSSSRINMVLVKPDGTVINPEIAENNEYIDFVSGGTYQYYRVVSPALIPGVWKMEIHGGTITESEGKELRAVEGGINYAVQVTAVSSLTSQLFFDRDSYSLVEPIKLVMSISDSQPIIGATVDVDVSAPSPTASQLIPMSEWIEFNGDLIPDPQRLEEITAANQAASDTLSLFDDGKHGDGLANDGVYANLYMKTYEPGTYKFTVKASGTSTMGDQFERYGELSTYIEDDPERTPTFTYIPLVIK